jgi:branched-subunit amino acid aminotransferase/4-amino-4-deoxychorismate lyase
VTSPVDADHAALRVLPLPYQREMPQVKHLATYGLLRHVRAARIAGYDDALFIDAAGNVAEGSTWNVCLHDRDQWLWPDAAVLEGVTMQLLRTALFEAGLAVATASVPASTLSGFHAAFATNSVTAARPISALGPHNLSPSPQHKRVLDELYEALPAQPV